MDFDDLIGNYVQLLEKHEDVRSELHERFQHLLIDEYQDTNRAQYVLIKAAGRQAGNIVAVGDEDQSIYRFRGADINNILNFERDFPGAKIIKLEQNYRSTGNILDAATGVVVEQHRAQGKDALHRAAAAAIRCGWSPCSNDREEAQFVVEKISALRARCKLTDFAVLFRTNAQSRPFEEELLRANMPYIVVGGVKFYERAEIKDIMSFLRLAVRPHDTPSDRARDQRARRAASATPRSTRSTSGARAANVSLWTVIEGDLAFLPSRASKAVREFREIVHDLQRAATNPLPELFDYVLLRTGYRRMLQESRDIQDESRLQNLEELFNSAREFCEQNPRRGAGRLPRLDDADLGPRPLRVGERRHADDAARREGSRVPRGLPGRHGRRDPAALAVAGRERGHRGGAPPLLRRHDPRARAALLPALARAPRARTVPRAEPVAVPRRDPGGGDGRRCGWPGRDTCPSRSRPSPGPPLSLERASASRRSRRAEGDSSNGVLSFFKDAPVKFDPAAIHAANGQERGAARNCKRGQRVRHEQFGDGTILTMEGSGPDAKLTVYFDRAGSKKFIAKYAKLTRI